MYSHRYVLSQEVHLQIMTKNNLIKCFIYLFLWLVEFLTLEWTGNGKLTDVKLSATEIKDTGYSSLPTTRGRSHQTHPLDGYFLIFYRN